jgi:hypothetical protein
MRVYVLNPRDVYYYARGARAARTRAWGPYVRQRAKGLPATAVHVILARKLLRVAYALAKSGRDFDPKRLAVA